jgi:thiol-disulfide isomerase/thioredoxin
MKLSHQLTLIAGIVAMTAVALGQAPPRPTSPLGKPAKPLAVAEWVKGEPVTLKEGLGKNIYVIELWTTTCPHSRGCIPHLTALQKKYEDKGVIFVAIAGESADAVKAFVEQMGDKIGYRVAVDKELATFKTYMGQVKVTTTPIAFLIDKEGNLVWYGHPMSGLDQTIDAVIAGTYDIETCKKRDGARGLMRGYFDTASSPSYADRAIRIGEKIIEDGQSDIMLMNEFAWKIATQPGLINRDLELAMQAAQIAYDGCNGQDAGILDTYARVLWESGKKKEAIEYQRKAVGLTDIEELRKELEKTLAKYEKALGKD